MISMLRRAVLLAAAVAVSGSLPAVAAVAAVPAWTVAVAPAPAATGTSSDGDIDCASGSFCVQVGTGVQLSGDRNTTPIAVVHSGSVATAAELPLPIDAERPHTSSGLGAVDCVSTRYCVAVGSYGTYDGRGRALIETYRNGTWTASSVSSPTGYGLGLTDVACNVSSCVATGGFFDGTTEQPIIAARDSHGVWTVPSIVGAPYFFQVRAPVCPPDGPCYAQGYEYPGAGSSLQRARFLYPTAAGWSGVYFPTPPGADEHTLVVGTMACPSVDFCTGIGTYKDSATGKHRLVAEQVKQGRLTARPVATPDAIATSKGYPSATATSCGGESAGVPCVAAVTPNAGASWYVEVTAGRWSTQPAPPPSGADADSVRVSAVSCTARGACSAVGRYQVNGERRPLVQRRTARGWQQVPLTLPAGVSPAQVGLHVLSCVGMSCHASGSTPGFPSSAAPYHLIYATS